MAEFRGSTGTVPASDRDSTAERDRGAMNTTRTNRKVIAAALIAALAGSLAACATTQKNESVTTVAHGAGELSAYLQITDQIRVERARLHPQSAVDVIQQDIAKERERLRDQGGTE